jgi:hypothetical protein
MSRLKGESRKAFRARMAECIERPPFIRAPRSTNTHWTKGGIA